MCEQWSTEMRLWNWNINKNSVSFQFPLWQIWIERNLLLEIKCLWIFFTYACILIISHFGSSKHFYRVWVYVFKLLKLFLFWSENNGIWTPKKEEEDEAKKTKFVWRRLVHNRKHSPSIILYNRLNWDDEPCFSLL